MCLYRQCMNAEQDMHSLAKICWTFFVLLLLFAVSYELAQANTNADERKLTVACTIKTMRQ